MLAKLQDRLSFDGVKRGQAVTDGSRPSMSALRSIHHSTDIPLTRHSIKHHSPGLGGRDYSHDALAAPAPQPTSIWRYCVHAK
jgi:hypothetical protein